MTHVLVLAGGPDAEHDVSLRSGLAIADALRARGYTVTEHVIPHTATINLASLPGDVIWPALHGPWGEGGVLQHLLEADGRPFVGCDSAAAACCMDKDRIKAAATALRLDTPQWCVSTDVSDDLLDGEVVVKPVDDGSSIHLHMCDSIDATRTAVTAVLQGRDRVMVERRVRGRELTVAWLIDRCLPLVEIVPATGVYDYQAKYGRDDTAYVVDPELPADVVDRCHVATERITAECGVRDLARVDFLLDDAGTPWLLEVNTMPGFTASSLFPMAAAATGRSMTDVCAALISHAVARSLDSAQA